jgi:uncharacterized protein
MGSHALELRSTDGSASPRLVGWASKFNAPSLDLGGFVETVRPGAFARSLRAGTDVLGLIDHDRAMIIGRRSAGTLAIGEDAQGLHVEITPPDTQPARDVIANIRAGNLKAMSFAFRVPPGGDQWHLQESPPRRELLDVDLVEVSIVSMPAYTTTSIALRSTASRPVPISPSSGRPRTVSERIAWMAGR